MLTASVTFSLTLKCVEEGVAINLAAGGKVRVEGAVLSLNGGKSFRLLILSSSYWVPTSCRYRLGVSLCIIIVDPHDKLVKEDMRERECERQGWGLGGGAGTECQADSVMSLESDSGLDLTILRS